MQVGEAVNIPPEQSAEPNAAVSRTGLSPLQETRMLVCSNRWYSVCFQRPSFYEDGLFFYPQRESGENSKKRGLNMNNMTEIRWHGRGGQGAKTASLLLADAAFLSGKYVQSFPEYGPEHSGAPITAYNRISEQRCPIHSNIYEPDYVVVVDETLLESVDVTAGLKPDGAIVINSAKPAEQLRPLLRGYPGRVFTIDAGAISHKHLGAYFPNTPMLAAIVAVSRCVEPEDFLRDMESSYRHKFANKPQVVQGNLDCLAEAMREVKE